jgi:hypothetical protein
MPGNRGGAVTQSTAGRTCPLECGGPVASPDKWGRGIMLEIVWSNPQPPARRRLRIEEVWADESTSAPMWVIFYHSIVDSGWPETEYRLFVNRNFDRKIAV